MSKQSAINDAINVALEQIVDLIVNDPDGDQLATKLREYKRRMLEGEHEKQAKDFTFDEIITTFKLKHSEGTVLSSRNEFAWAIEDELQSTFPVTQCFSTSRFLSNHMCDD